MWEESAKKQLQAACGLCALSSECSIGQLGLAHADSLTLCNHPAGPLHRGEHLFRAGDVFSGFYIVQAGCFKVYAIDPTGREYIHGFRFAGSILGLHSLAHDKIAHHFNAVAQATSAACHIDYEHFISMTTKIPELHAAFLKMIGDVLISNLFLSGNFTADERVASFLLVHADRLKSPLVDSDLYLPMTRGDIATYLRLALATVSRIISRLKQDGIIDANYHHIRVLDRVRLADLCKDVPFIND